MSDRYATTFERLIGKPWCIVCGRLLGRGFVCPDECLPSTAVAVGFPEPSDSGDRGDTQ